jgi:hypothetical protein
MSTTVNRNGQAGFVVSAKHFRPTRASRSTPSRGVALPAESGCDEGATTTKRGVVKDVADVSHTAVCATACFDRRQRVARGSGWVRSGAGAAAYRGCRERLGFEVEIPAEERTVANSKPGEPLHRALTDRVRPPRHPPPAGQPIGRTRALTGGAGDTPTFCARPGLRS